MPHFKKQNIEFYFITVEASKHKLKQKCRIVKEGEAYASPQESNSKHWFLVCKG